MRFITLTATIIAVGIAAIPALALPTSEFYPADTTSLKSNVYARELVARAPSAPVRPQAPVERPPATGVANPRPNGAATSNAGSQPYGHNGYNHPGSGVRR